MLSLTSVGFLPGEAFELVTHPSVGVCRRKATSRMILSMPAAVQKAPTLFFWWNDIEKDSRWVLDVLVALVLLTCA